jgi:hypothetical protein
MKQDITLKASKKSKKKQIMIERSSEEEEEDEDDYEGMTLFNKNYNKFTAKRRAINGNKGEKSRNRSKRVCYNCGQNGHFIDQCPYERREEDRNNNKKKDKTYTKDKRDKKYYKKKSYGEAHIEQEWNSNDESSDLVKIWQPLLSREALPLASHSSQISPSTHASWPKKTKRR